MELDSNARNSGGLHSSKCQQAVGWGECGVSGMGCYFLLQGDKGRGDEKDLTKLWVGGEESGEENGAKKLVKRIFSWEKIRFFF